MSNHHGLNTHTDKSECLLDKKARKQKYTCTYEAVFMNTTFYLC